MFSQGCQNCLLIAKRKILGLTKISKSFAGNEQILENSSEFLQTFSQVFLRIFSTCPEKLFVLKSSFENIIAFIWNFLGFWLSAEVFQRDCQNCMLRVRNNFLESQKHLNWSLATITFSREKILERKGQSNDAIIVVRNISRRKNRKVKVSLNKSTGSRSSIFKSSVVLSSLSFLSFL